MISAQAGILLASLDGTRTVREIQTNLMRLTGSLVFSDQIEALLHQLDECLLLENENFRRTLNIAKEAFHQAKVRQPVLSGSGYPNDPTELREMLNAFFEPPKEPGKPNGIKGERPPKAIVAPHIDLRRGGHTHAWAYKDLAESKPPSLKPLAS